MFGIQTETSTDSGGGTGGGINIGYVDVGDWLEYSIDVQTSGTYTIEYRLASDYGSDGFTTLVDGTQIDQQRVPNTGGWQSWITNQLLWIYKQVHKLFESPLSVAYGT